MKILHTADWHLGKNLEGQSRLKEQEAFLKDFVEIAKNENADLIIIAGDVYDTSNPPAKAEQLFYETLKELSQEGKRLILVIAGNHDNPERLISASPLAKEHGIIMLGSITNVLDTGTYGKHEVIMSKPGVLKISINGEEAVIIAISYPSEKRLNEVFFNSMQEEEERVKTYNDKIQELFKELSKEYQEDTINILTTHLFTINSIEEGSERSIQLGGTYVVDPKVFPKEAQYIALGHIHKPQKVLNTNQKARYCGSPIHYNKREIAFKKICIAVDLKAKQEAKIKEIPLKVYKPIRVIKCNGVEEAICECEALKNEDSWVYLEIKTKEYISQEDIKQMKAIKKDILEIIPLIESDDEEEFEIENFAQKSMEEIFCSFYKKERGVEPKKEVLKALLDISTNHD